MPGVVLLEALLACLPPGSTLLAAKFTAPVLPGQTVEVSSRASGGSRIAFTCSVAGATVLHGMAAAAP